LKIGNLFLTHNLFKEIASSTEISGELAMTRQNDGDYFILPFINEYLGHRPDVSGRCPVLTFSAEGGSSFGGDFCPALLLK